MVDRSLLPMLSDEREILNLLHLYCELQDAADFVGVAELFRHSSYVVAGGEAHFGYDEVYALETKHDRTYDDGTLRTKHVTTNTILDIEDDGPGPPRARTSRCCRPPRDSPCSP